MKVLNQMMGIDNQTMEEWQTNYGNITSKWWRNDNQMIYMWQTSDEGVTIK